MKIVALVSNDDSFVSECSKRWLFGWIIIIKAFRPFSIRKAGMKNGFDFYKLLYIKLL
jgi:hypothetical protein